ncbi:hypothetical protein FRC09_000316 [Ceratobasidium sp. 395]|nr:hypothetical protein FRC09_000316 [Ceratobasidium sp. 395]
MTPKRCELGKSLRRHRDQDPLLVSVSPVEKIVHLQVSEHERYVSDLVQLRLCSDIVRVFTMHVVNDSLAFIEFIGIYQN